MPRQAPISGRLKSIRGCGFLLDPNANPQGTDVLTLVFSIAIFQQQGNSLRRMNDAEDVEFPISRDDTFGCYENSYSEAVQPVVTKGDWAGVFVSQKNCTQLFVDRAVYLCPAHVNLIDPVRNCSQALYFNSTRSNIAMPREVNAFEGYPVNVFMNMEFIFGKLRQ